MTIALQNDHFIKWSVTWLTFNEVQLYFSGIFETYLQCCNSLKYYTPLINNHFYNHDLINYV